MKIKRKNKIRIIAFLIVSIILFTSFKPIDVIAVDDNYSTYLYNQNINVDNDKAHLLSEQSDGSNSYRNLFQSNFLFPAKLQFNMLSTSQTSSFSHYSFNQFYFDNLDNEYAYQSNDNSENFETSIVSNDFDVLNGTNVVNGSLENQDSSFGKYNATYSFDDYSETESNYGNYNATYSFWNEIGLTDYDIEFVDIISSSSCIVVDSFANHNGVLNISITESGVWGSIRNTLDVVSQSNTFEYYISISNSNERVYLATYYGGNVNDVRVEFDGNIYFVDDTGLIDTGITITENRFYHIKVFYDYSIRTWNLWIDGISIEKSGIPDLVINSVDTTPPTTTRIGSENYALVSLDAFGYESDTDYSINDNTNDYGIQSELENNDFEINYCLGFNAYINNTNDSFNNRMIIHSNSLVPVDYGYISNNFENQESGIIEFNIEMNNTRTTQITISTGLSTGILIFLGSLKIAYYDNTHNYQELGSFELDTKYNFRIHFDCNTDLFDLYVNNVLLGSNLEFYTNKDYINALQFTLYKQNNMKWIIDNIDYSWTNGYYENRINNVIPLNDNNYIFSYSEQSANEIYLGKIKANSDLTVQWHTQYGLTPHYAQIDDEGGITDGCEATASDDGQTESFTLGTQTIPSNYYVYQLRVRAYYNTFYMISDNCKFRLNIDGSWTDYEYLKSFGSGVVGWSDISIYVNLTQSQLDNIDIEIIAPTYIPSDHFGLYSLYIQVYCREYIIGLESETDISYIENETPVFHTLNYVITSSNNNKVNISIYNYDLSTYFKIKSFECYFSFNEYSFILNESAFFRHAKFKIKIDSINQNDNFNIFIDKMTLNITYITQNNNGYQELITYNHRFESDDSYKGYSRFELLVYNNSIKYRYSEINFETDDYIFNWIEYNTSNIEVKNIELQSHVRYGLNTLDIEIINFYYIIYINYDIKLEFREQSRKELSTHKIKSSFNYTSYTKNYLDLTGIIGNYSYNTFKGCRSLYGATTEIFHRNFQIPYFSDDIDVSIPLILPDGDVSNPDEPEPPTEYYWEYETFKTQYYQDVNINIGNWTVQFSQMRSTTYKAKYFYQPNSISKDDLGSWKWKIKFTDSFSYTVDFNFMRNAVKSIVNLILLFIQWIMFLCVASLSYIFMYLGTTILVFLWNVLVYALFYALIYIMWYLYVGIYLLLYYIWEGLIWVYETLLIPFFEWFWNEAIPYLIDWMIVILAHIITLVIYLITLGQVDYDSTYETVYLMLRYIADEIIEAITVFINHLDYILLFVLYYILLIGLLYLRYIYVKARGFNNRADQLHKAFEVFSMPIVWTIDLFRETKELVNPYS